MLNSILSTNVATLSITNLLMCVATSIVLGLIIGFVHMKTTNYTKNFIITLAVLPTLVSIVILMVNGNLGTSVAVLGAFGLVRFRSAQGNSKEIASVFFAMAIGLAIGMGHLVFASITTLIISIFIYILYKVNFGNRDKSEKELIVAIPESLDYTTVFDDILGKYTINSELRKVKTTNMGSLFEITYNVLLKKDINEKEFLDELRCRNGNLKIILTHPLEEGEL